LSSKKKKRLANWKKREAKRAVKKRTEEDYQKAMTSGDIEGMAAAMGIKLK